MFAGGWSGEAYLRQGLQTGMGSHLQEGPAGWQEPLGRRELAGQGLAAQPEVRGPGGSVILGSGFI